MNDPALVSLIFTASFYENENKQIVVREFAPSWVQDICREAHDELMPDDWRYRIIYDLSIAIAEHIEQENDWPDHDAINEMLDSIVPVYYHQHRDWFASHPIRAEYCNQVREAGLVPDDIAIMDWIHQGMYEEYAEVAQILIQQLQEVELDE